VPTHVFIYIHTYIHALAWLLHCEHYFLYCIQSRTCTIISFYIYTCPFAHAHTRHACMRTCALIIINTYTYIHDVCTYDDSHPHTHAHITGILVIIQTLTHIQTCTCDVYTYNNLSMSCVYVYAYNHLCMSCVYVYVCRHIKEYKGEYGCMDNGSRATMHREPLCIQRCTYDVYTYNHPCIHTYTHSCIQIHI